MRVLFVANDPPGHAVYRYRCVHFAEVLRRRGHAADVAYIGQPRIELRHDVVVLHRICANAEGKRLTAAARAYGAALVYSTDDLIFDEPALRSDARIPKRWADFAPLHLAMLRQADAVLVSTDALRVRAQEVAPGKPVYLLRNFLSPEMLSLAEQARNAARPPASGRVTLGYLSGSATHDGDLEHIAEALRDVLREWPEADLLLVPVRVPAALAAFVETPRLRRHPFVDWRELPALLATLDINLAPLEPGRLLNEGKSEIKGLEAAAVGIPTLASYRAGFAETCREGGFLCVTEDWRNYLRALRDEKRRQDRAADALKSLSSFGTFAQWEEPTERILGEIAALPRPRPTTSAPVPVNQSLSPRFLIKTTLKWLWKK